MSGAGTAPPFLHNTTAPTQGMGATAVSLVVGLKHSAVHSVLETLKVSFAAGQHAVMLLAAA